MIDPNTALTVGIPTLAVLIGILVNNSRLSDLRSHIDARMSDADRRITDLRSHMDTRFADLKETMNARFDTVGERLKHLESQPR